jgi:hypothetical protein
MDWKRIRMERKGGTFTLPMVMDTRMTRIRRRLRRIEMVRTFLKVMIFISLSSIPLSLPLSPCLPAGRHWEREG